MNASFRRLRERYRQISFATPASSGHESRICAWLNNADRRDNGGQEEKNNSPGVFLPVAVESKTVQK